MVFVKENNCLTINSLNGNNKRRESFRLNTDDRRQNERKVFSGAVLNGNSDERQNKKIGDARRKTGGEGAVDRGRE